VNRLKALAAIKGVGYQSLLRQFVDERVYEVKKREGIIGWRHSVENSLVAEPFLVRADGDEEDVGTERCLRPFLDGGGFFRDGGRGRFVCRSYLRILGSRASRRPSPKRVKLIMIRHRIPVGNHRR
jgi:hypothetical protein